MKKILLPPCLLIFYCSALFSQSFDVYNVSNSRIIKYDENGENSEIFIFEQLNRPQHILFLDDQSVVFISNINSGKITKCNASEGSYIGDFATGINKPSAMKIGVDSTMKIKFCTICDIHWFILDKTST